MSKYEARVAQLEKIASARVRPVQLRPPTPSTPPAAKARRAAALDQVCEHQMGDRPPARQLNWLFNGAHGWFEYLNQLHIEPEFLNRNYNWQGNHVFFGPTTRVQGDMQVSGESVYVAVKERSVLIPISEGRSSPDDGWLYDAATGQITGQPGVRRGWEIQVPSSCTLNAITVGYTVMQPGAVGPTIRLIRGSVPTGAGGVTNLEMINRSGATLSGAAGSYLYDSRVSDPFPSQMSIRNTRRFTFSIQPGSLTRLDSIRAIFGDVGPRNF